MALPVSTLVVGMIVAVVVAAGAVNGVAGFGFALVGTMALATVIDPVTAVVFMILPILAVNLSLVRDLSAPELRDCGERFGPLLLAALVGTVLGMALLDYLPDGPLRVGLGLVSLGFVASAQRLVPLPSISDSGNGCIVESPLGMAAVGGVSGLLFGGTNVGVQLVAYIRSCNLSHGLFVGIIAMIFLGLNGVRVVAAGALGLYPSTMFVAVSVVAAVPAVAGVTIGKRIRKLVTESRRRAVVLGLLTVIGFRLILGGLGIA